MKFGGNALFICFGAYAVVYFLGAASWLFIDANKPVVAEEPPPA